MTTPRVLVVDDEPAIRELCRVNLELEGFEVLEADTGEQAIDLVRAESPDFVFLDVMLPGIDGWETLRRLKQDDSTADVPVVMLTARTSDEDQMLGWTGGIVDYVAKPFEPRVLGDSVRRALEPESVDEIEQRRRSVLARLEAVREHRARSRR